MFKKKRKMNTLLQYMGLYPSGLISGITYSFEMDGLISGGLKTGRGGGLKVGFYGIFYSLTLLELECYITFFFK